MGKIIDYIALRTAFAVLTFIWLLYLTDSLLLSAAAAIAAAALFFFVFGRIKRKRGEKKYTADRLDKSLSLLGNKYVIELYRDAFYPNSIIINDRYFKCDNGIFYSNYKFGNVGQEDVAAVYRMSKETGQTKINVLCKGADRAAISLAGSVDVDMNFIGIKKLYKALKKNYALPNLPEEKKKSAITLGGLGDIIFNKANVRYYLITGLMLAIMYLFVPIKGYYLTVSTISLALAIISAARR